jgi:tetratricopeptide (TPR) repeat protein
MQKYFIFLFSLIPLFISAKQNELDSLLNALSKLNTNDSVKVETLNKIAQYYDRRSKDSCLFYSKQALSISEQIKYYRGIGLSYSNFGSFYVNKGEYQKALKNFIEAYKVFEKMQAHRAMSNIMNYIGNTYLGLKKNAKALEAYNQSYEIAEKNNIPYMMAISSIGIGNILLDYNNAKQALNNFKEAQKIFAENNEKFNSSVCYTLIAQAHFNLKEYQQAFDNYNRALKELEDDENTYGIAGTYQLIANSHKELENLPLALNYYLKAYSIFKERKALDNLRSLCFNISQIYKQQKQFEKALIFHEEYSSLKDSIYNNESNKQLLEIEAKYENEKKENQISLLSQEKKLKELELAQIAESNTRNKIIAIILSIAFVFVIVLLAYINKLNNARKEANINLKQKNDEVIKQKETIEIQKTLVEEKQKSIIDSIQYAKRIQQALLPSENYMERNILRLKNKN